MKTFAPRISSSPVAGSSFTSLYGHAGPIIPGLIRVAGVYVAAPQLSVIPQTSTIGTPRARYQRTRSGEIGAAPVTQKRALWMPISFLTLSRARRRASANCHFSATPTGWPARTRSATRPPTPIAQA